MKCQFFPFFGFLFTLAFAPGLTSAHAGETALDTAAIETITGLKGVSNQTEGTFKISKPRNDVAITVEADDLPSLLRPGKSAELSRGGQSGHRHAAVG